jgi:hypothetical protein
MTDLYYAINSAFLNRLGPDLVNIYGQVSRAWYTFLYLASKKTIITVAKYTINPLQ